MIGMKHTDVLIRRCMMYFNLARVKRCITYVSCKFAFFVIFYIYLLWMEVCYCKLKLISANIIRLHKARNYITLHSIKYAPFIKIIKVTFGYLYIMHQMFWESQSGFWALCMNYYKPKLNSTLIFVCVHYSTNIFLSPLSRLGDKTYRHMDRNTISLSCGYFMHFMQRMQEH
jgi:hypothetical protein